jgi:cell division protein FtsB
MKLKIFNRHSKILIALASFLLVFAVVFFAMLQKNVKTKQAELESLRLELQELQDENSELEYLINEADEAELFEHLARERGYVYPDEKVYYNVTPGS